MVPATLPQPGRYLVTTRGSAAPPGARYAVLDYVHDPAARYAARHYAGLHLQSNRTLAVELKAALDGAEPGPALRTHDVVDVLEVPGARLLVLDYVHDYHARVALWTYADVGGEVGKRVLAELRDSTPPFAEHMRLAGPARRGRW